MRKHVRKSGWPALILLLVLAAGVFTPALAEDSDPGNSNDRIELTKTA